MATDIGAKESLLLIRDFHKQGFAGHCSQPLGERTQVVAPKIRAERLGAEGYPVGFQSFLPA